MRWTLCIGAALLVCIAPSVSNALLENCGFTGQCPNQKCQPGHRQATREESIRGQEIGVLIMPGTCIEPDMQKMLSANTGADIEYLKKRTCSGNFGFPPGFNPKDASPANWTPIRNAKTGYVYFSGGGAGMNPGALRCFAEYFEKAERQGLKPCISAALRSPAHQRSSCMDSGNSVVCGRARSGRGGANSCPQDLSAYSKCAHVNGLAIDVNEKTGRLNELLSLARQMRFSKVGAGASDPWHIEAANCADPSYRPRPGPETYPPSPSPGPTTLPPYAPPSCTPRYYCSGTTLFSIDSSCGMQPMQQCPGGCMGNACVANPPQQPQQGQPGGAPQQPQQGGAPHSGPAAPPAIPEPTKVSDLLNPETLIKLFGTTTIPAVKKTSTSSRSTIESFVDDDIVSPLDISDILNADLEDVGRIQTAAMPEDPSEEGSESATSTPLSATGSIARLSEQPGAQVTFISSDLKDNPAYPQQQQSVSGGFFPGILADLRRVLEWALGFLQSLRQVR